MASLSVRNLGEDLLGRLKRRALESDAKTGFDDLATELRAVTARRRHTPAEDLLRESRNEPVTTFVIDASDEAELTARHPATA